jgi:hypothetical protein
MSDRERVAIEGTLLDGVMLAEMANDTSIEDVYRQLGIKEPAIDRNDSPETTHAPVKPYVLDSLAKHALGSEEIGQENLTVAAGLMMLHKGNGFYPYNNDEKNSLIGIAGRSTEVNFPIIRYFQEIEQHQKSYNVAAPMNALHSKVRSFGGYARQSVMEARMAKLFKNTLNERNIDDSSLVSAVFSVADLQDDETSRRTLTSIARLREIELFAEESGQNPLGEKNGIDSLQGKDRTMRILDLLGKFRISKLADFNTRLIIEEINRFDYWYQKIEESKMYGKSMRLVSSEILSKLDRL